MSIHPYSQIRQLWLDKIELASKRKHAEFGTYAEDCWRFYAAPNHDFLYLTGGALATSGWSIPMGSPKVTINKAFEMVDVFLPFMHHRNPTRIMQARRPQVPPELRLALFPPEMLQSPEVMQAVQQSRMQQLQQAQQSGQMINPMMAQQMLSAPPSEQELVQLLIPPDPRVPIEEIRKILMESYLNYTPHELDLKRESFKGLTEGLVSGRGIWWTESFPTTRGKMVGTFHVPTAEFGCDPDHNMPRDWEFVYRRKVQPKWRVLQRFPHLDPDQLKADGTSHAGHARYKAYGTLDANRDAKEGSSCDLVTYFEIWSRCGVGGRLHGAAPDLQTQVESLGDHVVLFICDGYPYPLNLDPRVMEMPEGAEREAAGTMMSDGLKWPVDCFRDPVWPWPFALLDFHHQPDSPWPVSHLRPALGEQMMLDWIWSNVAERIRLSGHGKWLLDKKKIDADFAEKFETFANEVFIPLKLKQGDRIQDVAMYLEAPQMNKDIWDAAIAFERMFEQRTGVSELLTTGATSRQMRSAAEAHLRERYSQSRPEAMADTYDDTQNRVARNEAVAARLTLDAENIAPWFGEAYDPTTSEQQPVMQVGPYTQMWMQTVFSEDPDEVLAETDFRIEAGSMRKPNVQEMGTALIETAQYVLPDFQMQAAQGFPQNYQTWLDQLSKFNHMPKFTVPNMPPPMPQGPPEKKEKAA